MEQQHGNLTIPTEFAGPAQIILYTRYGDPRMAGWNNKWLTTWDVQKKHNWFMEKEIPVHKHFRPLLDAAFTELAAMGLHTELKTFDGCYKLCDANEHTSVLPVHCWGAAIDLNVAENLTGSLGTWSAAFIQVMERNQIFCGQNWTGRKSPQHFAMIDG